MKLDLGQPIQKKCQDCGMEYRPSVTEDKKLHEKFHTQNLDGIALDKNFSLQLRALAAPSVESLELMGDVIYGDDLGGKSSWPKKFKIIRRLLDIVETDLGGVGISDEELRSRISDEREGLTGYGKIGDRYKFFMFLRKDKVLGVCLAERIFEGRAVLAGEHSSPPTEQQIRNSKGPQSEITGDDSALFADSKPQSATLGISRIWVSKCARGEGIAQQLLDEARESFFHGFTVPRHLVAFSQPTTSGAKLARQWFGKEHGWLVY